MGQIHTISDLDILNMHVSNSILRLEPYILENTFFNLIKLQQKYKNDYLWKITCFKKIFGRSGKEALSKKRQICFRNDTTC
jgi:hypothetical protein